MIEVKDAVHTAKWAANEFLGSEVELKDLQLEEVEFDKAKRAWVITLGFNVPITNRFERIGAAIGGPLHTRKYKTFIIDSETGEFLSMKIREI